MSTRRRGRGEGSITLRTDGRWMAVSENYEPKQLKEARYAKKTRTR